jgi:superfamily II DNA or RNA helicase
MSSGVDLPLAPGQSPLPWQVEAQQAIAREIRAGRTRILTSAATGSGKGSTIAGLIVLCARRKKRTLFIVHMDELIEDVMDRALLAEPRLIAGKVQGARNEIDRPCVFASAQTLQKDRLRDIGHFDYVFLDEAHRSATPQQKAIISRVLEVNPKAIILGFTATPYRTGSSGGTKGLGEVFQVLASQYPLEQAIRDGVLSPLVCKAVDTHLDLTGVDPDDEKKLAKVVDTDERNASVVDHYLQERPGKQAIAFGCSVQHAQRLAEAFTARGVAASWVSGSDPQRAEKIRAFKSGRTTVICCNDLLTTGFDHRPVEVVLLVRPTKSLLMFTQMVGRATRKYPGKESGLILDFAGNASGFGLASIADLSTPPPHVRITVGCIVRHRRDEDLAEGTVLALVPEDAAEVCWKGVEGRDGDFPVKDLVLLREARPPDVLTLTPAVLGTSTFTVELFGSEAGKRIGWYTYESDRYGKVQLARGKTVSALLIPDAPKSNDWSCYLLSRGDAPPTPIRRGRYHECQSAAVAAVPDPQDWNKDWLGDPATERQLSALRKFRVKRDKLSKGEAAMLLDVKIGLAKLFPSRAWKPRKQNELAY